MKYALLPGGFKPPHIGHYKSAKFLLENTDADYVIVLIGSGLRDGITPNVSLNIWNLYILTDPDPAAKKIKAFISDDPSPMVDAYNFVTQKAPKNSTIYLGVGEKNIEDERWKNFPKLNKETGIKTEIVTIPPQENGISSTELRDLIKQNNKKEIFKYFPSHLSNIEKKAAWDELKKVTESIIFSVDWWKKELSKNILTEGGAAGHMPHPFELSNVNNGKDLLNIFLKTAKSLKEKPGSLKIDGINVSLRLITINNVQQFVLDRGSNKTLDVKGITKDDLVSRFGEKHGMIKIGEKILDLFNSAIPSIELELEELGFFKNPNLMLNIEYVSDKTNVISYEGNFVVIHGVNEISRNKKTSIETNFELEVLDILVNKLKPIFSKYDYKVYGNIPVEITKNPDFSSALSKTYSINYSDRKDTKTLEQWLNGLTNIPSPNEKISIVDNNENKKVGALSKLIYTLLLNETNIEKLIPEEKNREKAINGFITYLATEKLGDEILKVSDSPMGSVEKHEGIIIKDNQISNIPFKITGKFIRDGLKSNF